MDNDDKIMLDDAVEELPVERVEIAFMRACRTLGIDGLDGLDEDDPDQIDAFSHELKKMVIQDTLDELIADGRIEYAGVDECGEVMYQVAKLT